MKIFTFLGVLCGTFLIMNTAAAQDGWPKTTTSSNGTVIKIYQWQPESFSDNNLQARAAISIVESGKSEPVFGVAWLKATTVTNGSQVQVQSIYITDIKLPEITDDNKLEELAQSMEKQAPSWNISFALSELQSAIDLNKKQNDLSSQINNNPPKVIYSNVPSILVQIDGAPKFKQNSDWGVEAVINTPFAIVKNNDGRFYLYGGKHWYSATSVTGNYGMITNPPANLSKIEQAVNEANKDNEADEQDANTIYKIIVSTEPAELIQTKGEPNFAAVQETGLLYVSNTDNDIFMDVNSQQYYVLISGRWYSSKTLGGNWQYIPSDKLPGDFAKIPAGSPKDNVLASVAGTDEAKDAVQEAQVPQTAKVDRKNTKANIAYDGDPEFEIIDGTDMYYAVNTSASVVRWRGRYYAVDNGVWFESYSAAGPWNVAVVRPYAVALIPPRYPVYYMKYVYIYDVYPDYVYMGYTPGYLNTYVYGPTVVYGTGYYYRPWYGNYYYPRPCTWGYGVRYNPWYGWGLNIGFSTGWFHVNVGFGNARPWGYWGYGGWWGPSVYRPPFCYTPYNNRGYYGGGGWYGGRGYYGYNRGGRQVNITNIYYNNNIYNSRRSNNRNIITRDNQRNVYNNRNGNGGRGNWADNNGRDRNNRFNNNNRGNRDGAFGERNAIPGQRQNDRERPVRQFNRGGDANGNNNNRQNNIFNRDNRERVRDNNNNDNSAWRNRRNNAQRDNDNNRQGRINQQQNPQRDATEGPRNFDRGNNRFERNARPGGNDRQEPAVRREVERRDNNRTQDRYNNDRPVREPQRRVFEQRQDNNRQSGGDRSPRVQPQQQRQPQREYSPPQRNSVRRDDGGGNNRSYGGGGGSRPSRNEGGGGGNNGGGRGGDRGGRRGG